MIIKVNKQDLLGGLQRVIGVVTQKNTLPILSNILIQTKEGGFLELIATDLDIGITEAIKTEVIEDGAITIPAKKFTDIIKELPEDEVKITTKKNNTINIECKNTFFKIIGIPKEEFPKLPTHTNKNKLTIPQNTLKEMLARTVFATSRDETRYILNGILFILNNDTTTMVATDGRRLAIIKKQTPLPKGLNIKVVVPSKTIQEISKMLGTEGQATISFDENQAMFNINETRIISRLIEGEFPNYEQAIPKQYKDILTIEKEKFLLAIKRAALLTTPDSQAIRLDVFKDKVVVSKIAPNIGEAKEELGCSYVGAEFFIGFNPTYLLEGLKNIKQDELNIEFQGAEKPAMVKDQEDYLYVVLPMQIA
ncbi:MAG: DNA polymerase III subunit beta [Candidatus Omnitrophota bacterium]